LPTGMSYDTFSLTNIACKHLFASIESIYHQPNPNYGLATFPKHIWIQR